MPSIKKIRKSLSKPKLTFGRFGQITFTLKEVGKLVFRVKPRLLIAVFILNAIWGFSSVPSFYLEKLILDKLVVAIGNPDWKPLFYSACFYTGIALLLSLLRNTLSGYNSFLRRNLSRYFDAELDALLGNKVSQLDLSTLEDPEFRDKFNKIESESGRRAWSLIMPISEIPNYLVGFISAAGVLILVHPLVSLGVFLVSLPRVLIDSKFIKKEYELHTELAPKFRTWGWIRNYLIQNRNFMEMKILGLSDYLTEKMKKVVDETLIKRESLSKKRELSGLISYLPLSLYEFGISTLLILWVVLGKITIGSFQLYLRSLRSAEQNLTGLVSSFLDIYENYIYVTDLVWFLNLETEPKLDIKKFESTAYKKTRIEFKDIWFKYQTKLPWVIRKVNFTIDPGEKIALVGENGAGKSTLIKLLGGFYLPQKGEINIEKKNLKEINLAFWRRNLAVLFQEFELYPFSVGEAIGYGDIEQVGNLEEMKRIAKRIGIDEFIEDLPLKYDNPLTPEFEKGVRPSIGQWQRLALARVLFRKEARILILDEPTSNVDPEAEEKIFKELVKIAKDKILIFVTQRFSTVRIADRILVMHKGEIIEDGTHKKLMTINGKYARLYNLQAQAYLGNK